MSRWQHEVQVVASSSNYVRLRCLCGWTSQGFDRPSVTALSQAAQDHRRQESRA